MSESGQLPDTPHCMYCTSWFTIQVATIGIQRFLQAWNNHPIPGTIAFVYIHVCVFFVVYTIVIVISLLCSGKKNGMPRGVPNVLMNKDNRAKKVHPGVLPSPDAAVQQYSASGGRISDPLTFGVDPLSGDPAKIAIRKQAFLSKYPSFETIFDGVCNGVFEPFRSALLFLVDITYRLSQ